MLYSWGPLQFEVHPLNLHELDHLTASQFAKKEVAGARPPREFVGEDDTELYVRGRVFPFRIGGLTELDVLDSMREAALAHPFVRGDGASLGWHVLERLVRSHRHLAATGVGQLVEFEGIFVRVPVPDAAEYMGELLRLIG